MGRGDSPAGRRGRGELESEVLAALWAAGEPVPARTVRGQLAEDPAYTTVLTVLSRLYDKGLVTRASNPEDRRQVSLDITEAGRAAHRDALAVVLSYNARILQGIPETLQREAARTLQAMAANLAPNPGARDGIIYYADPANDKD